MNTTAEIIGQIVIGFLTGVLRAALLGAAVGIIIILVRKCL